MIGGHCWECVSAPLQCITNIRHWPINNVYLWAESILDAYRHESLLQKKPDLFRVNFFAGEHDVAPAMDQERFQAVSYV